MAAPATAINDPSRILPALLSVDFVGTAAPLVLDPLLPAAEEIDGAGVVAGMEVLPSDEVTTVVAPVELPVGDAETDPSMWRGGWNRRGRQGCRGRHSC